MEKYKIKAKDILELMTYSYNISMTKNEDYKYMTKMYDLSVIDKRTIIDASEYIDDVMLYLFDYYMKINDTTQEQITKILSSYFEKDELDNIVSEQKRLLENFKMIYKKILLNSKFDNKNMINNQKKYIKYLIDEYIITEEYEICAELKKKLDII